MNLLGSVLCASELSPRCCYWTLEEHQSLLRISRSKLSIEMPSKLKGAYQTPKHVTQMNVSKNT